MRDSLRSCLSKACRNWLLLTCGLFCISCRLPAQEVVDFNRDIRPVLSENCFHCHGPDAEARQADLRLDVAGAAQAVLTAEGPQASELLRRVTTVDVAERMPPEEDGRRLNETQIALLERWIAAGAPYAEHWSFAPLVKPAVPAEYQDGWCQNEIDAFVLQQLRRLQLEPAPAASPELLIRRYFLDLVGLPPSTAELDALLHSLQAEVDAWMVYVALIDQLMASPAYGEHMALPWLEAARYADTDGYQNDRYRYQHAWRDWVIRAWNEHLPYDRFVIEQLAGDLLPQATLWQQVATGFGRNHRINSEDGSIPEEWRTENVVDRVDTLGTVFLGLTVGCARCHDHKYDPLSQRDYYRLYAYFNSIAEWGVGPNNGNSPPFIELPASWPQLSRAEDRLRVPDPMRLRPSREGTDGNGLKRPQAGSPQTVMVMHELPEPRPTFVLSRGQYHLPDESQPVTPGIPAALDLAYGPEARPESAQPRNRLELAQWLVDRSNPLTARVAVNRLWQQMFGMGLVETSENFGTQGTPPSHPALLDWLAAELIDSNWDLALVQRKILLSATYRQSSTASAEVLARDPQNRWLARGPRTRMTPFQIRDQALAAAGLLVRDVGGPSVKPYMPKSVWSSISNNQYQQDQGGSLFRRSLYTYWRRTIPPPTMMNFNSASREVCSVRTEVTHTPLQALTLLNNMTFVEAARCLAERMLATGAGSLEEHIRHGFQAIVCRQPSAAEIDVLVRAQQRFLEDFTSDPQAAKALLAIGESPRDQSLPAAEHAALTMVASLILNLDEAIHKE